MKPPEPTKARTPRRHRRPAAPSKPHAAGADSLALADALGHLARRIGIGDQYVPSGLELVAESLRIGLGELAAAVDRLAEAVAEGRS